jgi:hypothetical protein
MPRPSIPSGKSPLSSLLKFDENNHGFWKTTSAALRDAVEDAYRLRTEVIGVPVAVVAGASLADDALHLDWTDSFLQYMLAKGVPVVAADLSSAGDLDMLTAGAAVLQPVFLDGSTAAGLTLAAGQSVIGTIIVANSDGAGAVGTAAKLGVVFRDPAAAAEVAVQNPPSSAEVAAALAAAEGVHDGDISWAHFATIVWADTPAVTVTGNPNNHRGL